VEMDLSVDAYLPGTYVEDERQKIELYKRIRQFSSEDDYVELQDELIDRFGDYPQAVSDLLTVGLLKMYSETALVTNIKRDNNKVTVTFSPEGTRQYPLPEVFRALKDIPMKTDMQAEEKLTIDFKVPKRMEDNEWLDALVRFTKICAAYRLENEKKNEDQAEHDQQTEEE